MKTEPELSLTVSDIRQVTEFDGQDSSGPGFSSSQGPDAPVPVLQI